MSHWTEPAASAPGIRRVVARLEALVVIFGDRGEKALKPSLLLLIVFTHAPPGIAHET